ncbi:MAG: hypothetical protein QW666_01535 [Candidatus Woesearchaeota archaeon]
MISYLHLMMSVEYIRVNASNKKQIEKLLSKRQENAGILIMIVLGVAILGLVGLLYLS